ncbi:IS5 family transposase, partial [Salmonella enterica subsp. enterica]|nr:IS5 family transposase [Salmonella enterica subsp. enterica serovar Vuadens]EEJ6908828.1 IS5 family transposase [Salmonella enterica subsp. enterica serovar Stanleyville]HAK3940486.1 IS5 family transposase [Salmonella enterica]
MARYELSDTAWALISSLLPPEHSQKVGHPYVEHRRVINGMFWVLCSGAPWRDLPERYGPWKTVYNRFNRWSKSGIINIIFNRLLSILDENDCLDWSAISLDGSNIRACHCAAGAPKKHSDITTDNALGRSRGGYGTKIHLATDGQGLPLNIVLSGGQAHESQYALRLLDGIGVARKGGYLKRRGSAVLADKGYSSQSLRKALKMQGVKAIIPYKINEKAAADKRCRVDMEGYKSRNVVERCFGALKELRRVATRYEKTARNYLAMVKLGSIRLFLKKL